MAKTPRQSNDKSDEPSNATPPAHPPISGRDVVVEAVTFTDEKDNVPVVWNAPLGTLIGDEPEIRASKLGTPCFSLARYKPDAKRGNDGVEMVTGVSLDFDHITNDTLHRVSDVLAPFAGALYTTYSDRATGLEDRCARGIVLVSRPMRPDEYRLVREELIRRLDLSVDDSTSDPARIWFAPSCPAERKEFSFIHYSSGELLNVDEFLAAAPMASPIPAQLAVVTPTAITLARVRSRLEKMKDPDIRALLAPVLAGQAFAEKGARNTTLWRVICCAAFIAPDADPDTLVKLVEPSLAVMQTEDPSDSITAITAADMAERALGDARAAKLKVFERGDEVEIAKGLLEVLGADDLVHTEGNLYRYDGTTGLYGVVTRDELSREVQSFAGRLVMGDDKPRVLRVSRRMVDGACALAADQVSKPTFFDEAPRGIAFRNGFVTVSADGVQLHSHDRSNRARTALPFDFAPEAGCERFMQYLQEVFAGDVDADDKRAALQEFAGACLLGIATRYARAFILLGAGRNGKSVFIDILMALFPESAKASVAPQSFEQDYFRALLSGKLINSVAELPRADIMRGEAFKAIIAGDIVTARQIYQTPITFRPKAGHIMAANALPGSDDLTAAFWERVHIITFNRVFAQHERDKTLTARILATELPGVAFWALQGGARLLARGDHGAYTEPESHARVLAEWKLRADQVRQYVEERTRPTTEVSRRTQAMVLYADYKKWAQENGHRALANPGFGERLKALGIRKIKPHSQNFYEVELVSVSATPPSDFYRTPPVGKAGPVNPAGQEKEPRSQDASSNAAPKYDPPGPPEDSYGTGNVESETAGPRVKP